jgi:hypothetical protein
MKWCISIFSADGKRLIFAAKSNRTEAGELATEARRLGSFCARRAAGPPRSHNQLC